MKTVLVSGSHTSGLKTGALAHTPANNDDDPAGGGRSLRVRVRAPVKATEQPHRPWLAQGVGNVL